MFEWLSDTIEKNEIEKKRQSRTNVYLNLHTTRLSIKYLEQPPTKRNCRRTIDLNFQKTIEPIMGKSSTHFGRQFMYTKKL